MANPEERAGRALASWQRCGRDDGTLERAIVEQLEEALYWERYQIFERLDGLTDRYIGETNQSPEARNSALELLGEIKAMVRGRQHREDSRDRLLPDWRRDDGARVDVPELHREARPWPGPSLPASERRREAKTWTEAAHVREAPGTYKTGDR